ncbi:hypothetical protein OAE83_00975 [bacterium]|nr:hypothetical protein [bacterium]
MNYSFKELGIIFLSIFGSMIVVAIFANRDLFFPEDKQTASTPETAEPIRKVESRETLAFKARIACMDFVKRNLKDPSSFRKISNSEDVYRTKQLVYSANNSFGGRTQETFDCSPFFDLTNNN